MSYLKIFISYSQDSLDHSKRVLELANSLRSSGYDADLDQYHSNQNWPAWMEERLRWADRVLVICTETYLRRWENREAPGKGLGAQWESLLARQTLYELAGNNEKYIPCHFEANDANFIPIPLRPYSRVNLAGSYIDTIRRRIEGIPSAEKPPVRPSLAPIKPDQEFFKKPHHLGETNEELGLEMISEEIYLNLLPISFPEKIQVARLPRKRSARRDFDFDVKRFKTENFEPVFIIDEGKLYTFDSFGEQFWRNMLAERAITAEQSIDSSRFASSKIVGERSRFIKLLNKNLSQICRMNDISFSEDMKCYFFPAAKNTEIRYVAAKAIQKKSRRRIYKAIRSKEDPNRIQHWQHQAFRHKFQRFGGAWYLSITPFWAFTTDGLGKKSPWQKKSSANMRKPERNRAVLGHVLFWSSVLSRDSDLFYRRSCIKIGECMISSAPVSINDEAWIEYLTEDERIGMLEDDEFDKFNLG